MKFIVGIGVGAAVAASLALSASAATIGHHPVASSSAWVATKTLAFPAEQGLVDLGRVSDSTPLRITVSLPIRNRGSLDQLIAAQGTLGNPMYHKFLTPAQSAQMFSPSGAQVAAVASYLSSRGFTGLKVTPDNFLITANGTTGLASSAFATQIHAVRYGGSQFLANVLPALVPGTLAGDVLAVEGLQTMPMHVAMRKATAAAPGGRLSGGGRANATSSNCTLVPVVNSCVFNEFNPAGFQLAYDATKSTTGSNTTIAIFAEGDLTQVIKDLRQFETQQSLPQVPVNVIRPSLYSTDKSGADEWDLDTQYSTGMAQSVKALEVYDAFSLTDQDVGLEFDRFKTDDLAEAGSASFGECEVFPATDGALVTDDEILGVAAGQGQSVFSSAGDNGTTCPILLSTGVPATGLPAQSYPGSSEYVVSVGGTTLITNPNGTYNGEVTWSGSGGGISVEEPSPYWQQGIVPPVNNPPPPVPGVSTFKAVADISMDADPNTGANVDVGGTPTQIGGTSLASPLALGVWARLESDYFLKTHHYGRFAAVTLYEEYRKYLPGVPTTPPAGALTQPIGGFHDILFGTNGLPATPKYDYGTGLGTLDVGVQMQDSFPV